MTQTSRHLNAEIIAGLLADTNPYLSCDDCFVRLDEYVERRAADASYEDPAVKAHMAGCGACAEEVATLEELLRQDAL